MASACTPVLSPCSACAKSHQLFQCLLWILHQKGHCAAQDDEDDDEDDDDEEDDEDDEEAVQNTVVIKELNHDGFEKADVRPSAQSYAVTLHSPLLSHHLWLVWNGTARAATHRAEQASVDGNLWLISQPLLCGGCHVQYHVSVQMYGWQ